MLLTQQLSALLRDNFAGRRNDDRCQSGWWRAFVNFNEDLAAEDFRQDPSTSPTEEIPQEFLALHGGSRVDYGLQSVGDESLTSLKGNRQFRQVGPDSAQSRDLMILDAPPGERVGHSVMIQDRHILTPVERGSYPGMDAFARPNQNVQVFTVEASFGGALTAIPPRGGVRRVSSSITKTPRNGPT